MALTYEPIAGTSISHAANAAVAMANANLQSVKFDFNGVAVIVWPGDLPDSVTARWDRDFDESAKRWRDSPEGIKHQEWVQSETERRQKIVDGLMGSLTKAIDRGLGSIVGWLATLSEFGDWNSLQWDKQWVVAELLAAGYQENEHAGQPPEWFNTQERMGRYIVGQALNCMANGMPPHPMLQMFAYKYAELAG